MSGDKALSKTSLFKEFKVSIFVVFASENVILERSSILKYLHFINFLPLQSKFLPPSRLMSEIECSNGVKFF